MIRGLLSLALLVAGFVCLFGDLVMGHFSLLTVVGIPAVAIGLLGAFSRGLASSWLLFTGLALVLTDAVRLQTTGLALFGAVLVAFAFIGFGALHRSFWFTDDETSARLSAVDAELDERERHRTS